MTDLTTFNSLASDGKVLSPIEQEYPNTPLPQEILDYVAHNTAVLDDKDYVDRRYSFDDFADTENDTFNALYYAFSTKGKLRRLTIDYVNMLNHDELGEDNPTQWKRATILKSAIDARDLLAKHLNDALDEIEEQNYISDKTITDLVHLSVTTGHINTALTQQLADFVKNCPDLDYEAGNKKRHFLFEASNSLGGDYHIPDLRHGGAEEQLALVADGVKLAQTNRYTLPELRNSSRTQIAVPRDINFDEIVRVSIWGENALNADAPEDEPPEP